MKDEVRIQLDALKKRASERNDVNLEEVLAKGRVEGEFFFIKKVDYLAMTKRYQREIQLPSNSQSNCCGTTVLPKLGATGSLEFPPLREQAWNLAKAAGRRAKASVEGKRVEAPAEIVEQRKAICASCEYLKFHEKRKADCCVHCGCPYERKTTWATERCPIGKWERIV